MEELRVGRLHGLRLSEVEMVDGVPARLRVSLSLDGVEATKVVVADHYADGLERWASYFERLAADWRGWTGTRRFGSLEQDLVLEAVHDGIVVITARLSGVDEAWSVSGLILIEAGEELAQVARDARAFASARA